MEDQTYIVPPKLNEKLVICGFQPIEMFIIVLLIVILIITHIKALMIAGALLFVLWFRHDNEHNTLGRIIALWNYYSKPQKFTAKEVVIWYERNQYNRPG